MRTDRIFTTLTLAALALILVAAIPAQFSSGSTGASGELNVTSNTAVQLPESGVIHYTGITVAVGNTLTFLRNTANTPVILLATGNVTIDGTIDLNGEGGSTGSTATTNEPQGGPGGYPGGFGSSGAPGEDRIGTSGGGPGGGPAAAPPLDADPWEASDGDGGSGGSHFSQGQQGVDNDAGRGPTYGDSHLVTLTGGSGGAGSAVNSGLANFGPSGGAGGGAICIASSGMITVDGSITANGGVGRATDHSTYDESGAGAGGAIRLMANTIAGTGSLRATGSTTGRDSGVGRIRIEAYSITGPSDVSPAAGTGVPTIVSLPPAEQPVITIATINGLAVPDPATGSIASPDVVLPSGTANPATIEIETTNVPEGSTVNLRIPDATGNIITTASTLVAADGTATATALLGSGEFGVIYATVDFP